MTVPLLEAIAQVYVEHAPRTLSLFEQWTGIKETGTSGMSVECYIARSNAVIAKMGLGHVDPISSSKVSESFPDDVDFVPPEWSCIEAMRHGVCMDGYLWRTDVGGTVFVSPSRTPCTGLALIMDESFVRHVRMPWQIFLSACPRNIYRRVIVLTSSVTEMAEIAITSSLSKQGPEVVPFMTEPIGSGDHQTFFRIEVFDIGSHSSSLVVRDAKRLLFPVSIPDALGSKIETLRAMQADLLSKFATLRLEDPCLLEYDFFVRYIHASRMFFDGPRGALKPVCGASEGNSRVLGDVVVIENRPNIWSVLALLVTLDNVDPGRWGSVIFCGAGNTEFMERHVRPFAPFFRLVELPALSRTGGIDLEVYNALLKDGGAESIWTRLQRPRALIVQDDGMLVLPGFESCKSNFMQYDYVGAPWADVTENNPLKKIVPSLVGNGGFSLRNVAAMRRATSAASVVPGAAQGKQHRLFNHNLQPVPEDVFFASAAEAESRGCPTDVATKFSFEQRTPLHSEDTLPFGFHKPWAYIKHEDLSRYMDAVLRRTIASRTL